MKTINMTPYEIRLRLLQLSLDVLSAKHLAADVSNGNNQQTSPTTEEVIAEADKLNSFVSRGIT
jgi:hypothetical protein